MLENYQTRRWQALDLLKRKKSDKDKLYSQLRDEAIEDMDLGSDRDPNTDIERNLGALIGQDIMNCEGAKRDIIDETGLSIEETWDDEYKMLKGGGLQWSTHMASRTVAERKLRPNSEDNFIHPAIQIPVANITANPIEPTIKGRKEHEEKVKNITHMCRANDTRNKFNSAWKDIVTEFVAFGPAIIKVCWDPTWIGGSGPDRFIGDVRVKQVLKEELLVDPAIINLERDIQEAKVVGFKSRQKVTYIADRWTRFAPYISADLNDDPEVDEGHFGETTTLYEMYYKGFPEFVSDERKAELREKAMEQEEQGDIYKARDLYDMADGKLEGVHLAYYCDDLLLEYIPYYYENGKYPVAFRTRYRDTKAQWGYGEVRNIKIPQIAHNKADEIELEAMAKEGLGGGYYARESISKDQLDDILRYGGKPGMWFEVERLDGMKERTGVKVPHSITAYKEHKQRMVETVSSNTPIQQGMSPSANMPFKAIAELGARTDIRTKQAADKLADLLIEVNKLRIDLFAQFYTEERYYRYTDSNDKTHEGTFSNDEIFDVWARETIEQPIVDPNTGEPMMDPMTGEPMTETVEQNERFIPEFDVEIQIISKRPDDRDYHTNLGFELYNREIIGAEGLLYTLEEGKLQEREDILEEYYARNQIAQLVNQVQQLPPELQGVAMERMVQMLQATVQQGMMQSQQQAQMQQQQM